jgi:ATP-binding cassette, subfamily B, bacterial
VLRLQSAGALTNGIHTAWQAGTLSPLAWLVLGELLLAVAGDVLGRLGTLIDQLLAERFTNASSVRLMEHAATLDLEDLEDSELQDKLERARRQTLGRSFLLTQLLAQLESVLTVIAFAIGLLVYTPWLIVLLLVALLPAFLGEIRFNAESYALNYRWTPERRELDYLRATGASVETAKEVKIFGLHRYLVQRFRDLSEAFYAALRKLAIRRALLGALLTTLGTIGYYAAFGLIVWQTLAGQFTIGDLTFLSAAFRRLRQLLESLLTGFTQVAGQAMYLDDLYSFLAIQPEIASPATPRPLPERITEGFRFENVGFSYPGSNRWAVRHLDFTLAAGEVLALVGENGAGKTTLVKLLARLYDPDEGRILLDGHDLREYDLAELRSRIGVIFQDFVRFNFSAGENIAVGRIEARDDPDRIRAAAVAGLADQVIKRLPAGYEQPLGKRFRNGVELSGGEWQKIAIARAYMRDADVLILDEPTAALDARSEYEVFQRFRDLSEGKTAVLISHRFSTVRMADRIIVLEAGRIEAIGSHAELLVAGGRYAELFELQAAGYR